MRQQLAYIICTMPRSGSWLLSEALEKTRIAGSPREYFNELQEATWFEKWDVWSYADYLKRVLARGTTPNGVFGVKLHWYQFDGLPAKLSQIPGMEGLARYEMMRRAFGDPRYILLTRRDKVRQAVSFFRASRTCVWWKIPGVPEREPVIPESDLGYDYQGIDRLKKLLRAHHDNWRRYFDQNGIEPIPVVYEDLAHSYGSTVLDVLRALGVTIPAGLTIPQPRLQKQADGRSEEWVQRYHNDHRVRSLLPDAPQEATAPACGDWERAQVSASATRPSVLDHPWRRWIAENELLRIEERKILEVLARNGVNRPQAIAEVRALALDPCYQGGDRVAQRLHKLRSLLKVYGELAALSSSARAVERRPPVSREEFLESYYARNRPVVFTDLLTHWAAIRTWNPSFLKSACSAELVEIMPDRSADPRSELNPDRQKRELRFADYVDMVITGEASDGCNLVANNQFFKSAGVRRLLDDITPLPEYLARERLDGCILFGLATAGTVTPLQHATCNILIAQVYGRKRVKLIPSWQLGLVYNSVGVSSDVDCEDPDFDRFPLFRDATVIDLTLDAGDVLFLPAGWWHHVRELDISITLSFTNFVFPNEYQWDNPHIIQ